MLKENLIREKVAQAKSLLKYFNIDCWMTVTRESGLNGDPILPYLLPGDVTWLTVIMLFKNGNDAVIAGEYDIASVDELGVYRNVIGYKESLKSVFQEILKNENPRTIALNYSEDSEICDGLTHGLYIKMKNYLRELGFESRIISSEPIISAIRERKTKSEIKLIKKAIIEAERIFDEVRDFIKPGVSEIEIADFVRSKVKERNFTTAWDERICPSVFTGPETAEAHYKPTGRKVERGHVLNMDFGVKIDGYCSDLQRTFYVLEEGETSPPEEVIRGFNTIIRIIDESRKALKPGVKGIEVDTIARQILKENGYDEFPHALGHQVGRFAHDGTALLGPAWEKYGDRPFKELMPGMVFTIEPRLKVENRGVITIEEMVLVAENGAEWLSHPQKQIHIIRGIPIRGRYQELHNKVYLGGGYQILHL